MKKLAFALVLALGIIAFTATPGYTGGHVHGGVFIGVGPFWGWGYPWYYPPPYYYYPPPIVAQPQQPTMYIEQSTSSAEHWWYYCDASKGYYPYVKECPSGWERVPPVPTQ